MKIEPRSISVGRLFSESNNFFVPKYQRGYAWKESHVTDFCDDIEKCINKKKVENGSNHFFGGIVTVKHAVTGSSRNEYEVVDGQQRLSTFVLLVARLIKKYEDIENEAKKAGEEKKVTLIKNRCDGLIQNYISFEDEINKEFVNVEKLRLSKIDEDFYRRFVADESPVAGGISSHLRLERSAEIIDSFFDRVVSNKSLDAKIDDMKILQDFLNDDADIIFIWTETKQVAYKLFQVLNDRGVSLTEGDLLRARTLELLEGEGLQKSQDEIALLWDDILIDDPNKTENYLRWYYSAIVGSAPLRSELYEQFRDRFFGVDNDEKVTKAEAENIKKQVKDLKKGVEVFRNLTGGEWPYLRTMPPITQWDRHRLTILVDVLHHDYCMPLLFSSSDLGEKTFSDIVHTVEKFFFRYKMVCNAHIGAANSVYLKHAKIIKNDKSKFSIPELKKDLRTLINQKAKDDIFVQLLKNKMVYVSNRSNKHIKYLLTIVEDYWRSVEKNEENVRVLDKTRVFDQKSTTIEHIYPQNADKKDVEGSLEEVKHNLGNLTILSSTDNNFAENDTFTLKKPLLAKTTISMNLNVAKKMSWTSKFIDERENKLIDYSMKIFKF